MCPPALPLVAAAASTVASNAPVISAGLSAAGQGLSGLFRFRQSRREAAELERQSREQSRLDAEAESGRMDRARGFLARRRLSTLASGVDPNSGSAADRAAIDESVIARDLALQRYGVASRTINQRARARSLRASGVGDLAAGFIGAGAELLGEDELWPMFR